MVYCLFLREQRGKGATVPNSAFRAAKWWNINIGFKFPIEDPLVYKQAAVTASHEVKQARFLHPWIWLMMEGRTGAKNPYVSGCP